MVSLDIVPDNIEKFPIYHPLVNSFSAFLMGVGNIAILVEFWVQSGIKVTADEAEVTFHAILSGLCVEKKVGNVPLRGSINCNTVYPRIIDFNSK